MEGLRFEEIYLLLRQATHWTIMSADIRMSCGSIFCAGSSKLLDVLEPSRLAKYQKIMVDTKA